MQKSQHSHAIGRRAFMARGFLLCLALLGLRPGATQAASRKKKQARRKYVCTMCGYIYDPQQGDPAFQIEPGTAFQALPPEWACPVCGAEKSAFEPA